MSNIPGTPYDEDRGQYGEMAVSKMIEMLNEKNIPFQTSKQHFGDKWTPRKDRIYGDIVILNKYWFDVKRNSITERSIDDFEGIGYFLFHHFLNKGIFVSKSKMRIIRENEESRDTVRSGEQAFKYKRFYKYDDLMSIEKFLDEIIIPHLNDPA
ncbi:MAG: hypothetical protein GYA51_14820 [Candidatus Methanofastidiosa archaeon]|nr:hypothetical protein [Candidatus Methanofastidiosa archaeon]